MKEQSGKQTREMEGWDESRIVIFLIGFCLVLEAGLIYYQGGQNQTFVSTVIGISGLTMLFFSWFAPEVEENEERIIELTDIPPGLEKETSQSLSIPSPGEEGIAPSLGTELQTPVSPPEITVSSPPTTSEKVEIPQVETEPPPPEPALAWFDRLKAGLSKTREGFVKKIKTLVFGVTKIDGDLLDELEGTLFEADVGVKTTNQLLEKLHQKVEKDEIKDPQVIFQILKDDLKGRLAKFSAPPTMNPNGLTVFLIIGVNGVGKTTTIAKIAHKYVKEGKKVVLAAGDTFRAAAIDQLSIWGDRAGAEVIKGKEGGDPGALVFDAVHSAKKREADLLIVDTAGRMHVKVNLMDELRKIKKIVEKETEGGPHEILLVIDATTGQNAIQQAKLFNEALPLSGLVLTKLDGTAKGGVIFAVQEHLDLPVKFVGVGEKMDDLLPFDPDEFLNALFEEDPEKTKKSDYQVL